MKQGILRSQVVEPMRRVAQDSRLKITIVSGERRGDRNPAEEANLAAELHEQGIDIIYFEKRVAPAARTAKPSLLERAMAPVHLMNDVRRMSNLVVQFAKAHEPCVVHARSYVPAWAALKARKKNLCRLIFDPRGILPEELAFARGWSESSRKFQWWKSLEKRLLENADDVIAVSQPMADHCAAIAPVKPLVIRNCVDLERFRPGAHMPSADEPLRLIFLVGVDVPYQASELALEVQRIAQALWPGGALLRILSPDAEALQRRFGSEGVKCESVPRGEVPRIVGESDLGILVRDNTVGSRVACPVKFAEYLAAGLPVIATAGIGEVDDMLRESGCGVSLTEGNWEAQLRPLLESMVADREALRARCRALAERHFAWKTYLPLLKQAYGVSTP